MNYIKIQTELLKLMDKDKVQQVLYEQDDENVYLILDGLRVFIIPQKKFFINLDKIDKAPAKLKNMLKPDDADYARFKGEIKQLLDKHLIRKIVSEKHHAWVDEKLLKEYGNITNYKIMNEKSPVYLYEDEILLGIVLPVRVAEEASVENGK